MVNTSRWLGLTTHNWQCFQKAQWWPQKLHSFWTRWSHLKPSHRSGISTYNLVTNFCKLKINCKITFTLALTLKFSCDINSWIFFHTIVYHCHFQFLIGSPWKWADKMCIDNWQTQISARCNISVVVPRLKYYPLCVMHRYQAYNGVINIWDIQHLNG